MPEFSNRVIVVTGATGGLGGAVTRAFIEAGASVVSVARSVEPGEGGDARFLPLSADLTSPEECRAAIEKVLEKWKRIDALIHLLGGFAGGKPVAETDDETWNRMINLNLSAAFYIMRAALGPLMAAGRGRIVAVGSRTGVEPAARLSAYGVSKAGLVMLVRTIAAEVKNTGITANVVLPSVIDTPANRASDPAADFSKWVKPESIANLLVWLASEASADVNGAVIPVYGRA